MKLLVISQLRFLQRSPWSALTALIGVALGVASVVAVHLISAQVQRTLDEAAPPHLAGLTHLLSRSSLSADDYFRLREWWRAHPRAPVRALVPLVEGNAMLDGRRVQIFGVDWLALPAGTAGSPPGGAPLTVSPDVLVGEAVLADRSLELRVGDRFSVGGRSLTVAVVVDSGLGPALVADIGLAQQLLDVGPDRLTRVGLTVADPLALWRRLLDRLMPGFGAGLPEPTAASLPVLLGDSAADVAVAWQARPVTAERPSAAFARSVLFNLGALGTLSLLVAWFLIYQVGAIWLRRQHLVLRRLQMVGVDPGALRRSFLALFVALGLAATVLGGLLGVLLASLLMNLATESVELSTAPSISALVLDPWVLMKAVGSGLGVCLAGGYAAFARDWREDGGAARWRWFAIPFLALLVGAGVLAEDFGVIGGFLAILAMSLMAVVMVGPVLWLLRRFGRGGRRRLLTRLALREVAWYPKVLDIALAALTLAVATGIGVGLMVESFRADFQRMLDVRLSGDLYLYDLGNETEAVQRWLTAQPEVERVRPFGETDARVAGLPVELGYGEFDAAGSARYGFPRALGPGQALVSERLLRDLGVQVGDAVPLGREALTIVGTFPGFGDPRGRVLVDAASLGRLDLVPRYDRLTVYLRRDGGISQRLTDRFSEITVEPRGEIRAVALRIFDRTFAITQALTLLALLVAVVGIYNALTALRLNQAATAELLRAQGVTPAEHRHIALVRAATVGGVAVALALPLGIAMAWTLCAVINPRSFGWSVALQLPWAGWLPPVVLGLAAALLAGSLPAPRERGALHDSG